MRSHKTLARVCASALLLSAAQAHAQELALSEEAAAAKTDGERPRGTYTGVKPGGDESPCAPVKPGSTPPAITWPGFQMQPDGSSRVFVQISSQVDVSAALVDGKVIVDFGNVSIAGTNNRRPLVTKFFNTPVTSVEVKRANKRTTLVLTMRAPIEPRVSQEQAKSGFHFVYVDFPPGSYLPKELQAATVPPPGPLPTPDPPEAARPESAATRDAPAHLDGSASGSASGSFDAELPPGMGKTKAKASARGKAQAGGSFRIGQ